MELSNYERTLLLGVLDMHLEGMTDTREEMIKDNATLTDLDTFSQTIQLHDSDVRTIESIKWKVLHDG